MDEKPTTAAEYSSGQLSLVRGTCLYLATKLGDLLDDVVVVGGLVPSLLIDEERLNPQTQAHVGTTDLDIGLAVALLNEGRYRALTRRLRGAGFSPDVKPRREFDATAMDLLREPSGNKGSPGSAQV